MNEVKFVLDKSKKGRFFILDNEEEIARLEIKIDGNLLEALHTEVNSAYEGKGFGKNLFIEMVEYARENQLKVKSYCHYVEAQFKKDPALYTDVLR